MKSPILILTFTLLSLSIFGQKKLEKAIKLISEYEYFHAKNLLEEINEKSPCEECAIYLAECYYHMKEYPYAQFWYEKAFEYELNIVDDQQTENYTRTLIVNGHMDKAEVYLKDDPEQLEAIKSLLERSHTYNIKNLAINTDFSEYASSFSVNKLLVSQEYARKEEKKQDLFPWTGRPYYDLLIADWNAEAQQLDNLHPMHGEVNCKLHDASGTIDKLTNTLYFSRNCNANTKAKPGLDGEVKMEIYTAQFQDNKWGDIKPFPFESEEYSISHPFISNDGQYLFFVSDMEGSVGGTDIYFCTREYTNEWSTPQNLGSDINTEKDEFFPTLDDSLNLYFSSEGHTGMGGLDIFKAQKDSATHKWSSVENMGVPINSTYDDFGFIIIDNEKKHGFFSSDRSSGKGFDDIYFFENNSLKDTSDLVNGPIIKKVKTQTVTFTIVDEETENPLPKTDVVVIDTETGERKNFTTDNSGQITFEGDPNKNYDVEIHKDGYFKYVDQGLDPNGNNTFGLYKSELNKAIKIKNIYYDLNSASLRNTAQKELDKVVNLLQDNPSVEIELMSHTDSRGTDAYNLDLSNRRALSATNYIIMAGIDRKRIIAKGYGESQLVNHCSNYSSCSDAQHQENRRTEFKVLKYDNNQNPITQSAIEQKPTAQPQKNILKNIAETFYAVQLGVFSKKTNQFDELTVHGPITVIPHNDNFVYALGQKNTKVDAQKLKAAINKQVPDAFIIKLKASGK